MGLLPFFLARPDLFNSLEEERAHFPLKCFAIGTFRTGNVSTAAFLTTSSDQFERMEKEREEKFAPEPRCQSLRDNLVD